MLFKMAWTHSPEARDRTIKQFMETGGMPPENVELVSRYHNLDGTGGFAILESYRCCGTCRLCAGLEWPN